MIELFITLFRNIFWILATGISVFVSVILLGKKNKQLDESDQIINSIEKQNEIKQNVNKHTDSELDRELQKWKKPEEPS